MKFESQDSTLWSMVLAAGGNNASFQPFVCWLKGLKRNSIWRDDWIGSSLQSLLGLSDRLIAPERRVTVISGVRPREEAQVRCAYRSGQVIFQPAYRKTAAEIFLGLTCIRRKDPNATVLILPPDVLAYHNDRFVEITRSMALAAGKMKHWVFLLATCDRFNSNYGWVEPEGHLGWINRCRVRVTKSFQEKDSLQRCKSAAGASVLWNTMVVAARAETLWRMGVRCCPEIVRLFEAYFESIGTSHEKSVLQGIYDVMPEREFSSHLLQKSPGMVAIIEMRDSLWSNPGPPVRAVMPERRSVPLHRRVWNLLQGASLPRGLFNKKSSDCPPPRGDTSPNVSNFLK